ncbi:RDD family protein [Streptomyces lomondensis]|nr:RDD family protein [Streptomyces lomondensis]MCF0082988.1 RDD family protein [Streptomyces lomondensis]
MEEKESSSAESQHAPDSWLYGPQQPGGPPQPVLASAWTRAAAFISDIVIFGVALGVLGAAVTFILGGSSDLYGFPTFVVLLFCYSPICTAWWGGTPGKLAFGIRVVRARDGRRLSYGRALGRHMSHAGMQFVPFLNVINNLSCVWDKPLKQCFHDKIAASVVVERERS